jgi:hypothetical protein
VKIPKKTNNIYPKTKKNVKYLINYYFDDLEPNREGVIEYILSKTSLSLNQIEFIVQKTAENYSFFIQNFSNNSLLTFLKSAVDVLTKEPDEWDGSINRITLLSKIKNRFQNKDEFDDDYFIGTPRIIENSDKEFENQISDNNSDEDEDEYSDNENYSDENDYERDTFYALTDGQNGDYDDWRDNGGNLDDLMDELGH